MAYKGKFKPKNPEKYRGDPTKIVYRSSWEFRFFRFVDEHPEVVWWQSEELFIPYRSPVDGKIHRYFPDVLMKQKVGTEEKTIMIEIKPLGQTVMPDIRNKNKTKTGRISRRYLNEVKTYGINSAKWEAAEKYCKERGWEFQKLTEKDLF